MDLIRQMHENRAKLNMVRETAKQVFQPPPLAADKRPKTLAQRRKDIIDDCAKPKIVREYFTDLIARLTAYSDDEDEV